jgi:hypothetical protein
MGEEVVMMYSNLQLFNLKSKKAPRYAGEPCIMMNRAYLRSFLPKSTITGVATQIEE